MAVAWNPGVVARPGLLSSARLFFKANWLLLLPFISLGILWRLWSARGSARGRDPTRQPISPQYDVPDGLTPAEAGTLINNRPDMRDITVGLVDLAVSGYVKVEEVEKQGFARWFGKNDFRIVRPRGASPWDDLGYELRAVDSLQEHRISNPQRILLAHAVSRARARHGKSPGPPSPCGEAADTRSLPWRKASVGPKHSPCGSRFGSACWPLKHERKTLIRLLFSSKKVSLGKSSASGGRISIHQRPNESVQHRGKWCLPTR